MRNRFLILVKIFALFAFMASCDKSKHSQVTNRKNADNIFHEKEKKAAIQQWYAKQNLAAGLLNDIAPSQIKVPFESDDPLKVIEMQRSVIFNIDDLQVLSDQRKEILIKWCELQIEAVNCLKQIPNGRTGYRLEILDFDSIFEAQVESIRQINLRDK